MFDRISGRYDLLNLILSFGINQRWRRQAVELLGDMHNRTVLDLCCGTGDFIDIFQRKFKGQVRTIGVDFSERMLAIARKRLIKGRTTGVLLCQGDALRLPVCDSSINAVTIGFGIRNIENKAAAFAEIQRVLTPGGRLVIIEPALPANRVVRFIFSFYFRTIMPFIGGIISGNYSAYKYLNDSVIAFPHPDEFVHLLETAGFTDAHAYPRTLGTAMIYFAKKEVRPQVA